MKNKWSDKIGATIGIALAVLIGSIILGVVLIGGIKLLSWLWLM